MSFCLPRAHLYRDKEAQCEIMDNLNQLILRQDFDVNEDAPALAVCLCQLLSTYFDAKIFPDELDEE